MEKWEIDRMTKRSMAEKINIKLPCFWGSYSFDWSDITEFKVEDIKNLEYYEPHNSTPSNLESYLKYDFLEHSKLNDVNSYQPSEVLLFHWENGDSITYVADKSFFTLISIKKVPKSKSYYKSYDNLPRWFDNYIVEIEVNPYTQKGSEFIEVFGCAQQLCGIDEKHEGPNNDYSAVFIKFDSKKNTKSIIHDFMFCEYSLSNIIRSYLLPSSFPDSTSLVKMTGHNPMTGEVITHDVQPPHIRYNFRRGNMPYKNISGLPKDCWGNMTESNMTESLRKYWHSLYEEEKHIYIEEIF